MHGFVRGSDIDGYGILIDCAAFYKPACIIVERGIYRAEIYLSDPVSVRRPGRFSDSEIATIMDLVEANQDDLLDWFYGVREDARRGRLRERNEVTY